MFKADGTQVRDPQAFIAAFQKRGGTYEGGLLDEKGGTIKDPVAYVASLERQGKLPASTSKEVSRPKWKPKGEDSWETSATSAPRHERREAGSLYKADGTIVRDPAAFVAAFERRGGSYNGGLFDHKNVEIRDPVAYVAGMNRSSASMSWSAPQPSRGGHNLDSSLYKADGALVRDPEAYVASMKKSGGYVGGLFNSKGEEIRDPEAYLLRMGGWSKPSGGAYSYEPRVPTRQSPAGAPSASMVLYKADGTLVRDPAAFIAAFEKNGGRYNGGLFDANGTEIRNPSAYVQGSSRSEGGSWSSSPWPSSQDSSKALYKSDGTMVRDPIKYVESMEKSGGYQGGLYTSDGVEIRDAVAYINRMGEPRRPSPY